jgi:hypothetical protein
MLAGSVARRTGERSRAACTCCLGLVTVRCAVGASAALPSAAPICASPSRARSSVAAPAAGPVAGSAGGERSPSALTTIGSGIEAEMGRLPACNCC